MPELPIVRRFPALGGLPRASFGSYPTPVQRVVLGDGRALLVKRDDRSGSLIGGNKVRGLEWLLGDIAPGDRVLTVGPRGSTHALATAVCARSLGAEATVVRWNQEMNAAARRVDVRLRTAARVIDARSLPLAYALAAVIRVGRRVRLWVPAGGATARAVLGHVNAALELGDQIARGECERPERVVVPFGTGGTAAGLALGFRIAGLPTRVVAVRVVPRIVGRRRRLVGLAARAARLIEATSGIVIPRVSARDFDVDETHYAGGYGRPLRTGVGEGALDAMGISLDDTYGRKAFAAAMAAPSHSTLLWLTFDGRLLQD